MNQGNSADDALPMSIRLLVQRVNPDNSLTYGRLRDHVNGNASPLAIGATSPPLILIHVIRCPMGSAGCRRSSSVTVITDGGQNIAEYDTQRQHRLRQQQRGITHHRDVGQLRRPHRRPRLGRRDLADQPQESGGTVTVTWN